MAVILFDLDGTLVDSVPDLCTATNQLLAAAGRPGVTPEALRALVGHGVGDLVRRAFEATGEPLAPDALAAAIARFGDLYAACAVDTTRPYPGIVAALDALADHALGVVTNKPMRHTMRILDGLGLTPRFGVVVGGDTLPQRKPDPAPLWHARAALGGGPTVLVGDSHVDAQTAAHAGVPFVACLWGYPAGPGALQGAAEARAGTELAGAVRAALATLGRSPTP